MVLRTVTAEAVLRGGRGGGRGRGARRAWAPACCAGLARPAGGPGASARRHSCTAWRTQRQGQQRQQGQQQQQRQGPGAGAALTSGCKHRQPGSCRRPCSPRCRQPPSSSSTAGGRGGGEGSAVRLTSIHLLLAAWSGSWPAAGAERGHISALRGCQLPRLLAARAACRGRRCHRRLGCWPPLSPGRCRRGGARRIRLPLAGPCRPRAPAETLLASPRPARRLGRPAQAAAERRCGTPAARGSSPARLGRAGPAGGGTSPPTRPPCRRSGRSTWSAG
jgi:hypothetical protein